MEQLALFHLPERGIGRSEHPPLGTGEFTDEHVARCRRLRVQEGKSHFNACIFGHFYWPFKLLGF